jgi:hypothetical protein
MIDLASILFVLLSFLLLCVVSSVLCPEEERRGNEDPMGPASGWFIRKSIGEISGH